MPVLCLHGKEPPPPPKEFPPQQLNKYVHPEVPTGILAQRLWHPPCPHAVLQTIPQGENPLLHKKHWAGHFLYTTLGYQAHPSLEAFNAPAQCPISLSNQLVTWSMRIHGLGWAKNFLWC